MTETLKRSPSLGQLIVHAMTTRLADVHTALPAKVERYDSSKQLVDAKPLIKGYALNEDGGQDVEDLPVITEVPIVFPGAGGFRVTFPVAVGDTVLLVFAEASLDKWLQQGGNVDPGDTRRHHLADAIAIPGLHPFNAAWSGADSAGMTLGKDGGARIEILSSEIKLDGGTKKVANDSSKTIPHQHNVTGSAGPFPVVAIATPVPTDIDPMTCSATVKVP